jgi:energy-coupling factor transporter transmembrane protein EcfT
MNDTSKYTKVSGLIVRHVGTERGVVIVVLFISLIIAFARLVTSTISSNETSGITQPLMPQGAGLASK